MQLDRTITTEIFMRASWSMKLQTESYGLDRDLKDGHASEIDIVHRQIGYPDLPNTFATDEPAMANVINGDIVDIPAEEAYLHVDHH
ncbi:hypothetical protein NXC24_PB00076 (plasmid) [Rhizobium sp. NXC24]|nr:hypothetical protein NXC24_PB00076 [Rhizobium sp. NXC24]